MTFPSSASVTRFHNSHLAPLSEALLRVRTAEGNYPPAQDVMAEPVALAEWLMEEITLARWTALVDGTPAGHISLTKAHPYLLDALDSLGCRTYASYGFCEVSKFFTDPLHQHSGIGSTLFAAALQAGWDAGFHPTLAVIDTSVAARSFYAAKGMREVGTFTGIHGVNHVFAAEPGADR